MHIEKDIKLERLLSQNTTSLIIGVVDSIPDGILIVSSQSNIIACNTAFANMFDFNQDTYQYSNASVETLVNFHGTPIDLLLQESLAAGKETCEYRVQQRLVSGKNATVAVKVTPLHVDFIDDAFILIVRDITQMVAYEKRLGNLNKCHNMIGQSSQMKDLFRLVDQLAMVNTTVLVTGPSGTGKELVAEALHYNGPRKDKPLVKVNCSALPESVLESELFGHARGAFSGATSSRTGRFELAHGGTLFLDEIGELSPKIQVKLLRFLESKEFERIGESKTIKADVRIVAATNANLEAKVRKGLFRADLYFRLSVMSVELPELRDRGSDIIMLAEHFMEYYNTEFSKEVSELSADVVKFFLSYSWPGNVRELRNAMEHAVLLARGSTIRMEDLPAQIVGESAGVRHDVASCSHGIGPKDILRALERSAWKKTRAAELLGVHRSTLYRLMDKFQISR